MDLEITSATVLELSGIRVALNAAVRDLSDPDQQEAIQELITIHAILSGTSQPHGATPINVPDSIVRRDEGGGFTASGILLDTNATSLSGIGVVRWNGIDKCPECELEGGVVAQIPQESLVYVRNNYGSDLHNGDVVRVTGSQGQRVSVALACASTLSGCQSTIGLVTSPDGIDSNSFGYVSTFGLVRGLNTHGLPEGSEIWLSGDSPGVKTVTKPIGYSDFVVFIGWVVKEHSSNGMIFVAPTFRGTVIGDSVVSSTSHTQSQSVIGGPFVIKNTGVAVLSSGTVTVSNAAVLSGSLIFVNRFTDNGTIGASYSVSRAPGVSFTVTSRTSNGSTETGDTSTISYQLI